MRVLVLVKATESSERGDLPSVELMTEMGRFNEELINAGIMRAGDGLKPTRCAARVQFSGDQRLVTNGPFAETKELVAGYWLWEVDSMAQALEWVKRCPNPMPEDSIIEVRPLYELSDFAELDPDGSMAAEEEQLQRRLAAQQAKIEPYLFFAGRCAEALEFYRQSLGATIGMVMRFDESPDPVPPGMLQPGFEQKIMHSDFRIGDQRIMASDGCNDQSQMQGFRLALSVADPETAKKYFDALADGGSVEMPLTQTFWSPCYGMVTDRFGVGWMVMVAGN